MWPTVDKWKTIREEGYALFCFCILVAVADRDFLALSSLIVMLQGWGRFVAV